MILTESPERARMALTIACIAATLAAAAGARAGAATSAATCTTVGLSPSKGDVASAITAHGVTCGHARRVALGASRSDLYDYRSAGFVCTVVSTTPGSGLFAVGYRCTRGRAAITFTAADSRSQPRRCGDLPAERVLAIAADGVTCATARALAAGARPDRHHARAFSHYSYRGYACSVTRSSLTAPGRAGSTLAAGVLCDLAPHRARVAFLWRV